MGRYDEQLRCLENQMQRKETLREKLETLEKQQSLLACRVRELDRTRAKEQEDVDRLESAGLKTLYYRISGKMEAMRALEQAEANAAEAEYQTQNRALAELNDRIDELRRELSGLHGCEQQYRQIFSAKADAILRSGSFAAQQMRELDRRIALLDCQMQEIREAMSAGREAQRTAEAVMEKLDSADGWATWDLLGGGMIADLAKHSCMDEAQSLTMNLQSNLRRFQTELADVKITLDAQVNVEGFLRFADYFFDGLIADWTVKDRIGRSKEQIGCTHAEIKRALNGLKSMLKDTERAREDMVQERRNIVLQTEVDEA